jgi:hypothetical protein
VLKFLVANNGSTSEFRLVIYTVLFMLSLVIIPCGAGRVYAMIFHLISGGSSRSYPGTRITAIYLPSWRGASSLSKCML